MAARSRAPYDLRCQLRQSVSPYIQLRSSRRNDQDAMKMVLNGTCAADISSIAAIRVNVATSSADASGCQCCYSIFDTFNIIAAPPLGLLLHSSTSWLLLVMPPAMVHHSRRGPVSSSIVVTTYSHSRNVHKLRSRYHRRRRLA